MDGMTINHIVSIDHGSYQDIHASFLWKKIQVVGGLEHFDYFSI